MEEEKVVMRDYHDNNGYKIRCGYNYLVYRQDFANNVYYKVPMQKKKKDGTTLKGYKPVSFANPDKDCNIPDGTIIKPLSLYEDFYVKGYDTISTIVFKDWEIVRSEEAQKNEALNEYRNTIKTNEIELSDEDLPF